MKTWLKIFFSALLAAAAVPAAFAQQPVVTASITEIDVISNPVGGTVTNIIITNAGSGYTSNPTVTLNGGSPTVAATAAASTAGNPGPVNAISFTPGSGYSSTPTVTISGGGGSGATATAVVTYPGTAFGPGAVNGGPNESSGAFGAPGFINIFALATGPFPAGGYTYQFFVNGTSIGTATPNPAAGVPAGISWTPPQPGAYFISATATGGSVSATTLPVRFFATGTVVNSPVTNTIVPIGSSVVLKADATAAGGIRQTNPVL